MGSTSEYDALIVEIHVSANLFVMLFETSERIEGFLAKAKSKRSALMV